MDGGPVVWDAANRKHLLEDHLQRQLNQEKIDEVLTDENRVEIHQPERDVYLVIGRTHAGRWLVVAWVDHPKGRYPVHARFAGRQTSIVRALAESALAGAPSAFQAAAAASASEIVTSGGRLSEL
jgi:hypothetical protein